MDKINNFDKKIKFSVVTACFNARETIAETILSVRNQDYPNYEHIIIDGGSLDGTLDIIKKYAASDSRISFVSEKDEGVYDAMNKGISLSCGDYIQFLNSGDVFIDSTVLSRVAGYCNLKRNELLYGSIIYKYRNGKEGIRKYGKSCGRAVYFLTGDCINHQAIFASKGCFENCVFDKDNYRICADREWMMRVKKKHVPFVCMNEIVVKYSLAAGSLSVENKALSLQEERRCIIENYLWGYPIYFLFDFCRHNKYLKKGLHTIYKKLYISVRDDSSSK